GSRGDFPSSLFFSGSGGSLRGELLEEAARGGTPLSLVFAPASSRAVRLVGRGGQAEERDLADLHAGVDRDRGVGHVRQLAGQKTVPSRVDVPGRRVDQQPQSAERGLPL